MQNSEISKELPYKVNISFILPAYNVHSYLEECVKSIFLQDIQEFEIIIVDDGSTDSTYDVAVKLAESDYRIRVIHQDNRGVSAARNEGIAQACGKYICFIDPDDFYYVPFANMFYEVAERNHLDMIRGQYSHYRDGKFTSIKSKKFKNNDQILDGIEYLICCIEQHCLEVVPVLGLYKSAFLKRNNIRFPEGIGFEEDQLFTLQCLLVEDCKIMQLNHYFYAYRQHEGSVTHNASLKQITDCIYIVKAETDEIDKLSVKLSTRRKLKKYTTASFYQILSLYVMLEREDRKNAIHLVPIQMAISSIWFSNRIGASIKSALFVLCPELLVILSSRR